ncbi:MAG TPA: ABC transporter ATP-binding protein [Blastocatellia bacterium]|nr:ABC transporter ATP-binding protein [Blastocatellia bacterium]HMX27463.1 ABC transporter ATP-binding protein [Blastocatellia bacterium]HMZ21451.1 ABC transporter ATP-binding protein [Blastocatellia bacterium]
MQALAEVSFSVERGEFIALVGPSGCGKTSLLNVVAGLLPLTTGELLLNGEPIKGAGADRAMVFQSPALLPWRTVLGNVCYGLELQGVRRAEARRRALQFIELVGLRGFEASYPRELSGGMQQRANLARALAIEPALLLFDEPLAALDAQTRESMQTELERLWLRDQPTALFVTHQINEAVFLADRVLVMTERPGRILTEVPIDLPRPRPMRCRRLPYFIELEDYIHGLLLPGEEFSQTFQEEARVNRW